MDTELTVQANGKTWPVTLSGADGSFHADIDGHKISAPSLDALQKQANKVKVPFALPFSAISGRRVVHGTVTGLHASNGNSLVRWDGGDTEQVQAYDSRTVMPRLDDAGAAELEALLAARDEAVAALDAFVKPRKWAGLGTAARAARDAAVKGDTGE